MQATGLERRKVTGAASIPGTLPETVGCSRATLATHRRAPERADPDSAWYSQGGLRVLGPASCHVSGRADQGCDQGAHTPSRSVGADASRPSEGARSSLWGLPHLLPSFGVSLPAGRIPLRSS